MGGVVVVGTVVEGTVVGCVPEVDVAVGIVGFGVLPRSVVAAGLAQPATKPHNNEAIQTSAPSCLPFFIFLVLLIDSYIDSDGGISPPNRNVQCPQ